jgi:hypothetical protein
VGAIKEAADRKRKDLIPALEEAANTSADPDEPVRIWAMAALAKLGDKKYLSESIAGLTTTNSPMFKFWNERNQRLGMRKADAEREAELTAKGIALDQLVYIGDKSAVKYIAAELYNTNCPNRAGSDNLLSSRTPIAWLAARALSRMNLQDAPQPGVEADPEGLNRIEAWKKWWEQNKAKYP